jgi:hypothetical protein
MTVLGRAFLGPSGALTVSGAVLVMVQDTFFAGSGTVAITDGSGLFVDGDFSAGTGSGSTTTASVTGSGSLLDVTGQITIAAAATGRRPCQTLRIGDRLGHDGRSQRRQH